MTSILQFVEKNYSSKDVFVSDTELWVRNIFYTIQGEGPYAGYPATFIRLAGCNRGDKQSGCEFCDTDFLVSSSTKMSIDEIVNSVKSQTAKLVVITGGEPMMHKTLPNLVKALQVTHHVQVETNGDYIRIDSIPNVVIVSSPKIGKKGYVTPPKGMLERVDYLKFVVSADPTSMYHKLPDYAYDFDHTKVFVSPINEYVRPIEKGEIASMWSDAYDKVKCGLNHAYAAKLALDHSFRLSIQMHAFVAVP